MRVSDSLSSLLAVGRRSATPPYEGGAGKPGPALAPAAAGLVHGER